MTIPEEGSRPDDRETVAIPPLMRSFDQYLRRRDYYEFRRAIAACARHLEDLQREHPLLNSASTYPTR